jgi:hypothetical protein
MEMEKLLKLFIDNSWQCHVSPVSRPLHKKAVTVCDKLKKCLRNEMQTEPFAYSKDFFYRFKKCADLHNIYLQRESASASGYRS